MIVRRETARRDGPTVAIDDRYLHSNYDPHAEADRFAKKVIVDKTTRTLLIVGDGLGLTPAILRRQYPRLRTISIEPVPHDGTLETYYLSEDADRYAVSTPDEIRLRGRLRGSIRPAEIGGVQLVHWPAIDRCAPEWRRAVDRAIRGALEDLTAELATIAHFGALWIANALRTTLTVEKRAEARIVDGVPVIAGSGPTISALTSAHRPLAVSSALHYLRRSGVRSLLALHTDAGIWARRYLADVAPDHATIVAMPLRAGNARIETPLLLADRSITDELAPDVATFPHLPDQPSVALSLLDLARRIGATDACVAGVDLCSYDLFAHARPHPNDRYIAARSTRLTSEHAQRFARLRPEPTERRWSDGARAYHGSPLASLVAPIVERFMDQSFTIAPLQPSPVWRDISSVEPISPNSVTPVELELSLLDRPPEVRRRQHAQAVLEHWSDLLLLAGTDDDRRNELLLYLAPAEHLADLREMTAEAPAIAQKRLRRIMCKAGLA